MDSRNALSAPVAMILILIMVFFMFLGEEQETIQAAEYAKVDLRHPRLEGQILFMTKADQRVLFIAIANDTPDGVVKKILNAKSESELNELADSHHFKHASGSTPQEALSNIFTLITQ